MLAFQKTTFLNGMINNFKNITFRNNENEINAVFKRRFDFKTILKIFILLFILICLLNNSEYFKDSIVSWVVDTILYCVDAFLFFFSCWLVFTFFEKQKLTIKPFQSEATVKILSKERKISWPSQYTLDHEINFTLDRKMIDVTLHAYCPNSNKSIPIFSFVDVETFELFKKEYNLNFPSYPIN